jgi:hypothetical protein
MEEGQREGVISPYLYPLGVRAKLWQQEQLRYLRAEPGDTCMREGAMRKEEEKGGRSRSVEGGH